jgi:hypothetical protein
MAKSKVIRVSSEFDFMLDRIASEISKETGYTKSKYAATKKLAEINGKLVYKNNKLDWRIM